MSLVKQRIGFFGAEISVVLRKQQSLQIRRIVNRMRPGVGRQECKIVGKAPFNFGVQRVVTGIAVRRLRVD